jgi:hypothetical protein
MNKKKEISSIGASNGSVIDKLIFTYMRLVEVESEKKGIAK